MSGPLVTVVPATDGEAALSQLAVSKLHVGRDVAFCSDARYWEMLRFYEWLGIVSEPDIKRDLELVRSQSVADAMSHGSLLERAAASLAESPLTVERPEAPARPQGAGSGAGGPA